MLMPTSFFLAVLFLLQGGAAAGPPRTMDNVLAAVSRNVKDFEDLLPDFVCDEKITSSSYESGKLREIKMVESTFTAVQQPSAAPGRGRLAFTETREVLAIDGRPVQKGTRMPKLPLGMAGGFGALLGMTFSPKNLQYHNYDLDSRPDSAGRLIIRFTTKENQRELRTMLNGEGLINKDSGTAWIDPDTLQVERLEREFFSLPRALKQLQNTVEYGPTVIGDRQFWLPRSMRTDVTDRNPKSTKTFLAEYTNCKKFTTDIKIVP